jgi:putative phosphoribosyl transferase
MDDIEQTMQIPVAGVVLEADVVVPQPAQGVVLFAHGSGSSRHSPRNVFVAEELQAAGLATVLVDLLTPDEERIDAVTGEMRFDIGLLADRLTALCDWIVEHDLTSGSGLGLFGASTGAAAALVAAAARPDAVAAVVSRGGRPDLAGPMLPAVRQPTLLIVGDRDPVVLDLNRRALRELGGEARLEVVPAATHLFEEPGALEQVARLARDWFVRHLRPVSPSGSPSTGR